MAKASAEGSFSNAAISSGGGREAGQIQGRAADQVVPVGLPHRLHPLLFQARQNEAVDRRARPSRILYLGRRRILERQQRPEGLPLGRDRVLFRALGGGGRAGGGCGCRPHRACLDPRDDVFDLRLLELAAHGHLELCIGLPDGIHQNALVGIARHDGSAASAAFQQGHPAVHPQPAHGSTGVARVAIVCQDRPHFGFEKVRGSRGYRLRVDRAGRRTQKEQQSSAERTIRAAHRAFA